MRVTRELFVKNLIRNLHNAEIRQQELFTKVASGKNINKPSDDPMGVKKVISIKEELSQLDRFQSNVQEAKEHINFAEQALNSVMTKLEQALATAQQAGNATVDAGLRLMLSTQISQIIESLVSDANTSHAGKYIFGGTVTKQSPFNLTNEVEEALSLTAFDDPILLGNVRLSDDEVTVEAAGKTYGSANFDIDREKGTITILSGSEMEADGVTEFRISYKTRDSVVVFPESGATTGKQIREVIKGDELQINISGEEIFLREENIFENLRVLKNALVRNDVDWIKKSVGTLEKSVTQISKFAGIYALKFEHVQNVSDSLDYFKLQMQSLQSHIEDTDLAEASVKLELATTRYQAILSSASRMLNISLLDYLR